MEKEATEDHSFSLFLAGTLLFSNLQPQFLRALLQFLLRCHYVMRCEKKHSIPGMARVRTLAVMFYAALEPIGATDSG